jgi:multisubunit Na+/H+ antiporter MnhF subunit
VNAFVIAAVLMLVSVVPCAIVVWRGTVMEAAVGYEAISSIAVMVLALLAVGFGRFGELELPIVLAVLLFGSGLVFVHALERWL